MMAYVKFFLIVLIAVLVGYIVYKKFIEGRV